MKFVAIPNVIVINHVYYNLNLLDIEAFLDLKEEFVFSTSKKYLDINDFLLVHFFDLVYGDNNLVMMHKSHDMITVFY